VLTAARGPGVRPSLRFGWTPARLAVAGVAFGLLYALGAVLPFWFLHTPAAGAAFFPPAGLTVGLLLITPRRTWPVWMAAAAAGELVVDLTHGQTLAMALGFVLANIGEPLVGATVVQTVWNRGRQTGRRGLVVFLAGAVGIGPLFGAFVGALVASSTATGPGFDSVFGRWWLGDALGVLVVATPMLVWSLRMPDAPRFRAGETALFALVATGVTLVPAVLWSRPMVFAVLPVLVVVALRGGVRSVSLVGIGVAFAADWAAVTGRASELVPAVSSDDALVQVQLFIGVTLLAALILAVEVDDRLRAERQLREAETRRVHAELATLDAATGEQRRIAREVHDIVGHALNVMLLQAGAARRSMNGDNPLVREHLEAIEEVGRHAFRDLDVALGIVDRSPDLEPGKGLAYVPELVDTMRRAGMAVELVVEGDRPTLTTIVDWSAYRIVQEALTNVVKHSPGATARVTIAYAPDRVRLSVENDGPLGNGNGHGDGVRADRHGRGLIGIRERASVLGGEITYGPAARGGFAVEASLPLAGDRG
jgi:signal transduction histidine kinase